MKTLTYGGLNWLVLCECEKDNSILVLSEESIGNMSFDKDGNNDWEQSSLRKYLNNNFLALLEKNGADLSKIIMRRDKVSLLTVDEYRKYRDSIANLDNWWWLTASNDYPSLACTVDTDGSLMRIVTYSGYSGVRPVLTLSTRGGI